MSRRRRELPTRTDLKTANGVLAGETAIRSIALDAITVDPAVNPRRRLEDIDELAASIRAHGLLQPVVVRPDGSQRERYFLVAGYRRLAAIKLLTERFPGSRWSEVPAVIHGGDAASSPVIALIENLQRDDLSPRDEADALGRLVRERRWSTRQIASAVGKSQAYISRRLRVYDDPALRGPVLRGELPTSVAEELLAGDAPKRAELAKRAVQERWDRRRARAEARGYTAAFHPQLRAQVGALRELVTTATLSIGERTLLRQFGEFLLEQVPPVEHQ